MKQKQVGNAHRVLGRLCRPYIKPDFKGICSISQGLMVTGKKKDIMKIQCAACNRVSN